mmetsp:Transcript_13530/g.36531  ORF Transcript_13530/g.36531 Transcript_13530/m.36531 type:complete len:330 (+) Transcript_13530:228-1217(+)
MPTAATSSRGGNEGSRLQRGSTRKHAMRGGPRSAPEAPLPRSRAAARHHPRARGRPAAQRSSRARPRAAACSAAKCWRRGQSARSGGSPYQFRCRRRMAAPRAEKTPCWRLRPLAAASAMPAWRAGSRSAPRAAICNQPARHRREGRHLAWHPRRPLGRQVAPLWGRTSSLAAAAAAARESSSSPTPAGRTGRVPASRLRWGSSASNLWLRSRTRSSCCPRSDRRASHGGQSRSAFVLASASHGARARRSTRRPRRSWRSAARTAPRRFGTLATAIPSPATRWRRGDTPACLSTRACRRAHCPSTATSPSSSPGKRRGRSDVQGSVGTQ